MTKKYKSKQDYSRQDEVRNITVEGKAPPSAIEVERSVLGAILIDNFVFSDVMSVLKPEYFYDKKHTIIFRTMMDIEHKSEPVDLQTLIDELKRNKQLEAAGDTEYLIEIVDNVSSSAFVKQHALIVYHKHILRDLIHLSGTILEECFDASADPFRILNEASRQLLDTSESISKQRIVSVRDEVQKVFEMLGARRGNKNFIPGVTSGFKALDNLTLGFQNSELIIVAGRPSHGKTAITLNIARNAATKNYNVAFFSLEMTKSEIISRLLSSEAKINGMKLKSGSTTDFDWSQVIQSMANLKKMNIFIDDTSDMNVLELRAKSRRLHHDLLNQYAQKAETGKGEDIPNGGLHLIIVDYLQLLKGEGYYERRDLEVAHVSRSLKALAKELNIPVIAAAQVNRGIEQRGKEKKPQLSDLRESGSIEQDADVVMFVYREFLINKPHEGTPEYDEQKTKAELIVAKQRNGPVGSIELKYIGEYARFENLAMNVPADMPVEYSGEKPF